MHADWRASYHADTKPLWARERVVTTYRRIDSAWGPLDHNGLPISLTGDDHG
jgi:hypothetical protein